MTGPSGAGKSLWLRSLFGWSASGVTPALSTRAGAFLLVQDPSQGLTPGLSLAGHFAEVCPASRRAELLPLLARLGLEGDDLLTRPLQRFSGGERQRLMLALLLIQNPRVLVCDEPVASLDPASEARLWELLLPLREQTGLTAIIVTHRLSLIERYADEVLLLESGKLAFHGTTQTFFEQPATSWHSTLLEQYRGQDTSPAPEPAHDSAPLLQVRELCHGFAGRSLFQNFSLTLRRGELLWLNGPSGSGKTTLAKILAGLSRADRVALDFAGAPLAPLLADRPRALRPRIQYLFQHGTLSHNPARSVAAQLAEALPATATRLDLLRQLRLEHLDLERGPGAFSMGEIQRFNLLRALAQEPALLIADELLAAMDLGVRQAVLELLARQRRERQTAVLLISHEPPNPLGCASRHLSLAPAGAA